MFHELRLQAEEVGRKIAEAFDVVGLLAIELFVTENGVVVVHGPDASRIGNPAPSTPVGNRTFVKATGAFESSTHKERQGAVLRSLRE